MSVALAKDPPRTLKDFKEAITPLAIETLSQYKKYARLVDSLAVLPQRTRAQDKYLATLTILIEAFDAKNVRLSADLTPLEALRFLVKEHGMSGRELGSVLGQPQLGNKILKGSRELSKAHIRALSEYFKVSPGLFL